MGSAVSSGKAVSSPEDENSRSASTSLGGSGAASDRFHAVGSRKMSAVKPGSGKIEAPPLVIIPHLKSYESSPQIISVISDNLKFVNEFDTNNKTVLMWAVEKGRQDVMEKLIANGAKLEATDNDGWTPLMYAARRGNVPIAKYLIEQGANIMQRSISDNFTPLHLACGNECIDMAEFLVDHGADIDAKDNSGRTPGYYMKVRGNKERLHSASAKISGSGKTPESIRNAREEVLSEKKVNAKMDYYTS